MSEHPSGERIDSPERYLLPYGVGGDYVGARRTRRAFRLTVFACVGFTFALFFVERYMRYELNEVQYRMALTLEDDSQRAILRNVVRRDAERRELPTARYVEALAYIEEEDVVLERYAEAARLAPDKGTLFIVYGCKLFQQKRYKEAQEVFREANLKTTRNALPKYLQAAAQAASSETEEDFRTAMALVGRTNESGEQVTFPQPLWHESLPKSSGYFEAMKMRLVDEVCAPPLYALRNIVIKRARSAPMLESGDFQVWDGWLAQLQSLGERLVGGETYRAEGGGVPAALCGLIVQKDALEQRIALRERRGASDDLDSLTARLARVQDAIERVHVFEEEREIFLSESERRVGRPLGLAAIGLSVLGVAVTLAWIVSRVFKTDKCARTLRQRPGDIRLAMGWALLCGLTIVVSGTPLADGLGPGLLGMWYGLMVGMLIYALVMPRTCLPAPELVCQPFLEDPDYSERLREARQRRWRAYLSLNGRYLNILLGTFVIVLSVLFLGFRVGTGLYPIDVKLLTPGMESREVVLFNDLYKMLSS